MVQGLIRRRHAWKRIMSMLNSVYEKEFDPDTDCWFYVNKVSYHPFVVADVVVARYVANTLVWDHPWALAEGDDLSPYLYGAYELDLLVSFA